MKRNDFFPSKFEHSKYIYIKMLLMRLCQREFLLSIFLARSKTLFSNTFKANLLVFFSREEGNKTRKKLSCFYLVIFCGR